MMMQPKHSKAYEVYKKFQYLCGERYNYPFPFHWLIHYYCCYVHTRFLKDSLLTILDYETWKPRRRVYDPAFSKRWNAL